MITKERDGKINILVYGRRKESKKEKKLSVLDDLDCEQLSSRDGSGDFWGALSSTQDCMVGQCGACIRSLHF